MNMSNILAKYEVLIIITRHKWLVEDTNIADVRVLYDWWMDQILNTENYLVTLN